MNPQSSEQAYREIRRETRTAWELINLFDSSKTEHSENLFASQKESRLNNFNDYWKPGSSQPLFSFYDRPKFHPINRLFLAVDFWRSFPNYLRENIDQFAWRFPGLVDNYGDRWGGLERMYHFVYE